MARVEAEIIVIHPFKHHAFHLAAGCAASGRSVRAIFPIFEKGLISILRYFPGSIGRKASGYACSTLDGATVISPLRWQLERLISFFWGGAEVFQNRFDLYSARKVKSGQWRAKTFVLLQDHMPKTAIAIKESGAKLWSDQINFSYEASPRIEEYCRYLGYPRSTRCEDNNYKILRSADVVTAPSMYAFESIKARMAQSAVFELVPYGVDLGSYAAKRGSRDDDYIMFCARANNIHKGGVLLLRALSICGKSLCDVLGVKRLEINIIGEMDEPVRKELATHHFDERIEFISGPVPNADIPALMSRASLFIMPSVSESMSLMCIEAMASGLPLIVSKYVGVDALIGSRCAILVELTESSLVDAILSFAMAPDRWCEMGALSKAASSNFGWEKYEKMISDVARRL